MLEYFVAVSKAFLSKVCLTVYCQHKNTIKENDFGNLELSSFLSKLFSFMRQF